MLPAALAELHALCFTTPRPWQADEFAALLVTPGIFLVSHGHGFALGRIAGPEAELLTLAVHPEARNAGHGRRLLEDFLRKATNDGAEDVFLEVAENNAAAIALYLRSGFKKVAERAHYFRQQQGPALTAHIYKRVISPK